MNARCRVFSILGLLIAGACHDAASPPPGPASLAISPPGATLAVGSQLQLSAVVRDSRGDEITDTTVQWSSSDTAVVAVSAAGVLTARAAAVAIVTATAADLQATSIITVVAAVGQVWIPFPNDTIAVGDTAHFYAIVYDERGRELQNRIQVWSTPDSAVVRAVQYGGPVLAIGIAPGVAYVIVTVEGKADTALVTVQ